MPVSPAQAEHLAAGVVAHYQDAEAALVARIAKNLAKGIDTPEWAATKLAQMQEYERQARRLLADLEKKAASGIETAITDAYERGGLSAVDDISRMMKTFTVENYANGLSEDVRRTLTKEIIPWQSGPRSLSWSVAQEAINPYFEGQTSTLVTRAADGRLAGISAYTTGERLHLLEVKYLAANPDVPGAGTKMMQEICAIAAKDQSSVELGSVTEARGFYEHIGMKPLGTIGSGHTGFAFTPEQAAAFARSPVLVEPLAGLRAIEALTAETLGNVVATHRGILRSVMDTYQTVIGKGEQAALQATLRGTIADTAGGVLTGTTTRRQAAQAALNRFAQKGITGFVDSAGRGWSMESYTEMALRTGCGRAAVQGHVDRLTANGLDLVIVSDAPKECELCRPWEGKVLSIGGVPVEMPPETDPAFQVAPQDAPTTQVEVPAEVPMDDADMALRSAMLTASDSTARSDVQGELLSQVGDNRITGAQLDEAMQRYDAAGGEITFAKMTPDEALAELPYRADAAPMRMSQEAYFAQHRDEFPGAESWADAKVVIDKNIQDRFAAAPIATRVPSPAVDDLLQEGRFKTVYETGVSIGGDNNAEYLAGRAGAETRLFGAPKNLAADLRPVYGYSTAQAGGSAGYGDVEFVMKDAVKARSTLTVGDSLNYRVHTVGRPVLAPTAECVPEEFAKLAYSGDWTAHTADEIMAQADAYAEVQMHGGVLLEDVHSVVVHGGIPTPNGRILSDAQTGLVEKLRNMGMTVVVSRER